MNFDRGWSDNSGVVLRHRLVAWLEQYHRENPGLIPTNSMVAEALAAPIEEVIEITNSLHAQGLANAPDRLVPSEGNAWLNSQGKAVAAEWQTRRNSRAQRRTACRDAALDWLYAQPKDIPDATGFLADVRSHYFGEQFTEDELVDAVEYLRNVGLVTGFDSSAPMLLRPRVTEDGMSCVERFDSSVAAWQDRDRGRVETTSYHFTGNQGLNFAQESPGAQQSVTISTDARRQVLQVADALEQTLPVLQLAPDDEREAVATVRELRDVVETPEDVGRAEKALRAAKRLAVSGAAQAAGAGIGVLAEETLRALGIG